MHFLVVSACLCFLIFLPGATTVRAQDKEPQELTEVRKAFEAKQQNAIKSVNEKYLRALEELKDRLTRRGDPEGPLAVEKEIEKLQAQLSGHNDVVVSVRGYSRKLGSKVYLSVGDRVEISATGVVNPWPGSSDDKSCGPDGEGNRCYGCLVPDGHMGGLIARIGEGPWFLVGSRNVLTAQRSGELIFAINDVIYDDNKGAFTVLIRKMDK